MLNGGKITENIQNIMNTEFVYAFADESESSIMHKFNSKIKVIPIVDHQFILMDYFEYRSDLHIPVAAPDLAGNEINYLIDAFLSTWISSSGDYITRFEKEFAKFCETSHGIATCNGTTALHLALVALGIKEGDEVIVPDLTFAATINAVLHANATPVIVDVEKDSWCISPKEIRKAISPKTKAIIPVHLYGQPADMGAIMQIARENGFFVVEDCAEAHGATFRGKKVGSFGDIACFSFFGNKIITTGEGGMCVTNDVVLADRMSQLRDHGMSKTKKYWHELPGYNYRMTNLQAAIGVAQLERIEQILKDRSKIEQTYRSILSLSKHIEFQRNDLPDRKKITWLVSIFIDTDRNRYLEKLKSLGIDARPFFYSMTEMPPYKKYLFSNKNSLEISKRGINLPTNNLLANNVIKLIERTLNMEMVI